MLSRQTFLDATDTTPSPVSLADGSEQVTYSPSSTRHEAIMEDAQLSSYRSSMETNWAPVVGFCASEVPWLGAGGCCRTGPPIIRGPSDAAFIEPDAECWDANENGLEEFANTE
jgi:hypothetical protein